MANQAKSKYGRNKLSKTVTSDLGISEGIIYAWKQKYEQQDESRVAALERENTQLRQQLKQMEMERDILKKATAIFAKSG